MTVLEKFQTINECETTKALHDAILSFADDYNSIQGRTRSFSATKMASFVPLVVFQGASPNLLTREFGIRQQALYLRYYLTN